MRKSCALTLADKNRLKTAAKAFTKYGPNLSIKDNLGKEIASLSAWPKSLKSDGKFLRGDKTKTNYNELIINLENQKGVFVSIKTKDVCEMEGCGATANLEAHHLNPMVSIKRKDLSPMEKKFIAEKRKTVTLCEKHHQMMHKKRILTKDK